ncbi:CorA family divalent cation transporter [Actinotalea fermentans]|uniref:Magnesium transport protein CorA n=1 Tax=Actinotalea fermentans TaxID=43671 RepID=A0A511YVC7_9CELL|nr:CorA family divalent cation transporter [Actinotalea fermentans]KGM16363.1 hypothetical protein N867_01085 [Actinotalea fermentans ATCC 43279 = JCM 9966 = DSM 3133]GEN79096.1 magnesium transport protein CorA [Actinotalea fermentans]
MAIALVWTRTGPHWHPDGLASAADVTWVRVDSPADFAEVGKEHGLPEQLLAHVAPRSARPARTKPHVELLDGGGIHLVAPTLSFNDPTDVVTGEISCLVVGDVVLTAETGQAGVLDRVQERLAQPQSSPDRLTGGLLSALLLALVQSASDVEDMIADAVVSLEDVVFSPREDAPVERLYEVKREIAEARRALEPLGAELPDLLVDPSGAAPADAWVRRVIAAVDRLDRRLEDHDELLADMLSAHLALVSVAQNEQMRTISAWAATLAVPTLVGTIYGMNFVHMPELHWSVGYPLALGFMAAVGTTVNLLFRRSGWL